MAWIRACGGGSPAVPDGKTVTPINDVTIWQQCAGIANPTYTTLAEVLADTGILQTLMASNNAVDYLVRCKEWCGTALVPTMTSNTTPSGVASADSVYSSEFEAYKAFDNDNATRWASTSDTTTATLKYQFTHAVNITKVYIKNAASATVTIQVKGSNDGTTWTNVDAPFTVGATSELAQLLNNNNNYEYYACYCSGGWGLSLWTVQLYSANICNNQYAMQYIGQNNYASDTLLADSDWCEAICNSTYFESVLNVKVPTMTSATTPSGIVSVTSENSGISRYGWKAFDGVSSASNQWNSAEGVKTARISYSFTSPIKVVRVDITPSPSSYGSRIKDFNILGTNNNFVTSKNLFSGTMENTTTTITNHTYIFANNADYECYGVDVLNSHETLADGCVGAFEIQFYGREDV